MTICLLLMLAAAIGDAVGAEQVGGDHMQPFSLHPDNPHYFLFRDRPTVLVTSAEHYGAVLNADFDYVRYLEALAAAGLNHTRTFVGAYCEPQGAFGIERNTLAPAPGRFVSPWARSASPGYANGGNRFDLDRWDEAYFVRLRDFIQQAGRRGIVVEVNLFCPFYREEMWDLSPMKASNNVNGVGDVAREEAYTLDRHGGLLSVQETMVRKVVDELRAFDNLFYEVMNEPYARDVPSAWQARIVEILIDAQGQAERHLISLNVANRKADARELLSMMPPETVALNHDLGLAIGDNETGFAGQDDFTYRREAWAFLHAGGALFNHLDYSFAVGHEDGTYDYPETQPGGGSANLRASLAALRQFIESFDFVRMAPMAPDRLTGHPDGVAAFGLQEPGRQLAVYLCRTDEPSTATSVDLTLQWPAGRYGVEWVEPESGTVVGSREIEHGGGEWTLRSPSFAEDIALRVRVR